MAAGQSVDPARYRAMSDQAMTASRAGSGALNPGRRRGRSRHLKYAVLHLAAGVEVLLKARLQYEHWSLVFAQPGTATREALAEAPFRSQSPLPKRKPSHSKPTRAARAPA